MHWQFEGGISMSSILIIDDDPGVVRVLRRALVREGFEVHEAGDGQTALRRFAGSPTDLVITDICMPGMGGLEFLQRVSETFPEARLVAMSGGGATPKGPLLEAARALGASAVLEKPFPLKEAVELVHRCLDDVADEDADTSATAV